MAVSRNFELIHQFRPLLIIQLDIVLIQLPHIRLMIVLDPPQAHGHVSNVAPRQKMGHALARLEVELH